MTRIIEREIEGSENGRRKRRGQEGTQNPNEQFLIQAGLENIGQATTRITFSSDEEE